MMIEHIKNILVATMQLLKKVLGIKSPSLLYCDQEEFKTKEIWKNK